MNLTNITQTPLHIAFDEVCDKAQKRGIRVTGSELVGLVPKSAMLEAGKFSYANSNAPGIAGRRNHPHSHPFHGT